ncbi:uncharacterized protein LOC121368972 isoform X4 [Gigantopelta aegis]|uniref:uncharacterized protein LOC121368972 isoform X4 n=1 Tax=Gigantopelta aegis TaxID=1735272 RepID=UPI001B88D19F|nr:uncharacterized protein LOC121368972 isoform X4 [Gigantopelta aegis]
MKQCRVCDQDEMCDHQNGNCVKRDQDGVSELPLIVLLGSTVILILITTALSFLLKKFGFSQRQQSGPHETHERPAIQEGLIRMNDINENQDERRNESTQRSLIFLL